MLSRTQVMVARLGYTERVTCRHHVLGSVRLVSDLMRDVTNAVAVIGLFRQRLLSDCSRDVVAMLR